VGLFLFACSKKEELASREKGLDTAMVRGIAKDATDRPVKIKVDSVLSK
jgi:hypothetical protein